MRRLAGLALLLAAFAPLDLDVDVPKGSPFDSMKIPKDTPSSRPRDAGTPGGGKGGQSGSTVAEDARRPTSTEDLRKPPSRPPSALPGIEKAATADYNGHLDWRPFDMASGAPPEIEGRFKRRAPRPETPPSKWDMSHYPAPVPDDLYEYVVARFLMVLLHPAMVSERELTQFLIEVGYPAYHAATGCQREAGVQRMAAEVMQAVGPRSGAPPGQPATDVVRRVAMDLLWRHCYEPAFARWILAQPTEVTLPAILDIVKTHNHVELKRSAVFVLRCYNVPDVVPVLRDLLTTTSDKVLRNRALAALVRWKDEGSVEWLCGQAGGADVGFRNSAVWALGRIGSPAAIDRLLSLVSDGSSDPEFLWTAVPALGHLCGRAAKDQKAKIEQALLQLLDAVSRLEDPPGWKGAGAMATRGPEPVNVRAAILRQRVRYALAMAGRAQDRDYVRGLSAGDVLVPNGELWKEACERIR